MFQLIVVVIAIMLMGVLSVAGVNYISADSGVRQETRLLLSTGLVNFSAAIQAYRIERSRFPAPTSGDGVSVLATELVPYFGTGSEQRAPANMRWAGYRLAGNSAFACIEFEGVTEGQYNGYRQFAKDYPDAVYPGDEDTCAGSAPGAVSARALVDSLGGPDQIPPAGSYPHSGHAWLKIGG